LTSKSTLITVEVSNILSRTQKSYILPSSVLENGHP
jgi:hypothetical protein